MLHKVVPPRNERPHSNLTGMKCLIPFQPEWNVPFHSSQSEVSHSGQNGMAHSILPGMECHSLARLKKYASGRSPLPAYG